MVVQEKKYYLRLQNLSSPITPTSLYAGRTEFNHLSELENDGEGNINRLFITSPKTKPTSEMLGIRLEFSIVFVTKAAQGSI